MVMAMILDHSQVLALAAAQHGLVTRAQLLALGLGPGVVDGWVRRGQLIRVHRGVYRLTTAEVTRRQIALAAVLRCGPGACADGITSCGLHQLEGFSLSLRPGVLVPIGRRVRKDAFTVAAEEIPRSHRTTAQRVPCLTIPRALVEVAPDVEEKRLRVAFDSARRRRQITLERLEDVARSVPDAPGSEIVLAMLGSGVLRPESEGERALQALLHDFEDLEWGVEDLVPGRRLDCLMRDALLVLEYDGRDHHILPTDRDADGLRDLEVGAVVVDGARLELFRVTAGMIRHDPEGVRRRVRALRNRRRVEVAALRLLAHASQAHETRASAGCSQPRGT